MQGALSATQDEIAWAMTFNILATAVVTPMTGWLASRFAGQDDGLVGFWCFTPATRLCGTAQSLEVVGCGASCRAALGAPVVPLSQSILFVTFPRRQQRIVTSIFGMAVVVAPVLGLTVGGISSEMYNWRWAFYMIGAGRVHLVCRQG